MKPATRLAMIAATLGPALLFGPSHAAQPAPASCAALANGASPNTPWVGRTRLLCPYPQKPRKVGSDMESAASFRCVR